jgi:hypothetical protein
MQSLLGSQAPQIEQVASFASSLPVQRSLFDAMSESA